MRFALLGADTETCLLAQAALDLGHELIWSGDVASVDGTAFAWQNSADQGAEWEVLCDNQFCDFVIVGRGSVPAPQRAEQLIQIVKNGVNVVTSFPLVESVLSYYEIDMARAESNAVLYHFNPLLARSDQIKQFAEWIADGHSEIGRIEQLVCDRLLLNRTREQVMRHFPRDVELLDRIAGPLDRLGALGTQDPQTAYSALSVQLLGRSNLPVRWSIGPPDQTEFPSLTFIGAKGRVQFQFDESGVFTEGNHEGELSPTRAAAECIKQFTGAITDAQLPKTTWPAALRAMELTDTIEISLRRGRMIEVHPQQLTEELSFRGRMSAASCGVLVVLPPLLIFAGWLAEVIGLPIPRYWWAYLLLILLGLFLLVQFLPTLLVKKPAEQRAEET